MNPASEMKMYEGCSSKTISVVWLQANKLVYSLEFTRNIEVLDIRKPRTFCTNPHSHLTTVQLAVMLGMLIGSVQSP